MRNLVGVSSSFPSVLTVYVHLAGPEASVGPDLEKVHLSPSFPYCGWINRNLWPRSRSPGRPLLMQWTAPIIGITMTAKQTHRKVPRYVCQ